MFNLTVRTLLSGQFICQTMHPNLFRFLQDATNRHDIENYLKRLDCVILSTESEDLFFLGFKCGAFVDTKEARDVLVKSSRIIQPIIMFIALVMRATLNETPMTEGFVIELNKIMNDIDSNPSLRDELQALSARLKLPPESTDRSRMERVLKALKDEGYLYLANPERDIYQVTGKIHYAYQVGDYLMEINGIQSDIENEENEITHDPFNDERQGLLL